MRVVSVLNMKGGVGKTTMAVNIAHGLAAEHDKRVLLIDADPQFNASTSVMTPDQYLEHVNDPKKKTILDIFKPNADRLNTASKRQGKGGTGGIDLKDCTFTAYSQLHGRLDIIPSNLLVMELQFSDRGAENKLKNFVREKAQGYDYVFIDCPPTISFFTIAAVLASTDYLVPIKPDPLSAIGLPLLERWIDEKMGDFGLDLNYIGIVFTMVKTNRTLQMREVMKNLREDHPGKVFAAQMRDLTAAAQATAANSPILSFCPNKPLADDVRLITKEFLERTK